MFLILPRVMNLLSSKNQDQPTQKKTLMKAVSFPEIGKKTRKIRNKTPAK